MQIRETQNLSLSCLETEYGKKRIEKYITGLRYPGFHRRVQFSKVAYAKYLFVFVHHIKMHGTPLSIEHSTCTNHFRLFIFLTFNFCQFCVVIFLIYPRHNGQGHPTSKNFLSPILSITLFYLNS